jgi:nuclear GTP-binding protein
LRAHGPGLALPPRFRRQRNILAAAHQPAIFTSSFARDIRHFLPFLLTKHHLSFTLTGHRHHTASAMGTGKKEASRRVRQGKDGKDGMGNIKVKGENFYRDGKRVKQLNIWKEGKAEHNAAGEVTKAASYQSKETPVARIEPNRKWFTNTRVISQDALAKFRGAVEEQSKDPYSFLLKQNKLPMSLINDNKGKERVDGLLQHAAKIKIEGEKFGATFGPNAQRKRPKLAVSSIEDLAASTGNDLDTYDERRKDKAMLSGQTLDEEPANDQAYYIPDAGELTSSREAIFSKGQSKRIWNELYKVIDSSDVVIHVLDARDPLGTRCRSIEKYIKDEAPHKHLLFLLNKCDLVPTNVAVCSNPFSHTFTYSHPLFL